MHKEITKLL